MGRTACGGEGATCSCSWESETSAPCAGPGWGGAGAVCSESGEVGRLSRREQELRPESRRGSAPLLPLAARVSLPKPATAPPAGSSSVLPRFPLPASLSPRPAVDEPFPSLTGQSPAWLPKTRPKRARCPGTASPGPLAICPVPPLRCQSLLRRALLVLEWWCWENRGLILLRPSTQPAPGTCTARGWLMTRKKLCEDRGWGSPSDSFPSSFSGPLSHASVSPSSRKNQQILKGPRLRQIDTATITELPLSPNPLTPGPFSFRAA